MRGSQVSPLAEANFASDARAARLVLKLFASKLTLVPLDVTEAAPLSGEGLMVAKGGASARLFAEAFHTFRTANCEIVGICDGAPVHDAHVVAYALMPELYQVEQHAVDVLVARPGDVSNGACVVDRRRGQTEGPTLINVLTNVDARAFTRELIAAVAALP